METGVMLVGVAVFLVFAFALIGGPAIVVDWLRRRRRETVRRQIALTDAIHGELGAIVSPVVKRPLWGPWEVTIAVPLGRRGVIGRVLALADEVFSGAEGTRVAPYRLVLSGIEAHFAQSDEHRDQRTAQRWAGNPLGAA